MTTPPPIRLTPGQRRIINLHRGGSELLDSAFAAGAELRSDRITFATATAADLFMQWTEFRAELGRDQLDHDRDLSREERRDARAAISLHRHTATTAAAPAGERHSVWHADGSRCVSVSCARHHVLQPIGR